LFDRNNALADSVAEAAYRERVQRLDAKARKRRRPDDDEDDDDRYQETERERRQRARKAAEALTTRGWLLRHYDPVSPGAASRPCGEHQGVSSMGLGERGRLRVDQPTITG
jgi:hypothetical protein